MTVRGKKAIDRLVKIAEEKEGREKAADLRRILKRRLETEFSKSQLQRRERRAATSSSRTARSQET